ncbi:transposase, partial [Candidatus Bathyarchaeota archaeon]|nr:transposase [Candidatus Bathyarchaeota archaeon]
MSPHPPTWRRFQIEGYETLESLMNSLDLSFVKHLIVSCYHQDGPGRPPRNPLGLFKAHLARRYLRISSLRELERRLWIDERLRAICGIGREERIYRKRSIIELAFAWLKEHLNLNNHKARGLQNITIHASYCILCLLYTIEASHNTKHSSKTRSLTYWTNRQSSLMPRLLKPQA